MSIYSCPARVGAVVLAAAGTLALGAGIAGAATVTGTFKATSAITVDGLGTIDLAGYAYHYSTTTPPNPVVNTWTDVPMDLATATIGLDMKCSITANDMPTKFGLTCTTHIVTGRFAGCIVRHLPEVTVDHDPPPADRYEGSADPTFVVSTCPGGETATLGAELHGRGVTVKLFL